MRKGELNPADFDLNLPQERVRAIASERDTLRIAEVSTGATTHKLDALPGRVTASLLHPDGRRLFLGVSNGLIYEWDLEAFRLDRDVEPVR